jgi:hypothetical protein
MGCLGWCGVADFAEGVGVGVDVGKSSKVELGERGLEYPAGGGVGEDGGGFEVKVLVQLE